MKHLLIALMFAAAPALADEIVVVEGATVTIRLPFVPVHHTSSSPGVAGIAIDGRTIRITGKARGRASCSVFDGAGKTRRIDYDIDVVSEDLARRLDYLRRELAGLEGVDVRVQGDSVVVDGDVEFESELIEIDKLTSGLENVQNLVRLSPAAVRRLSREHERETLSREPGRETPIPSPLDIVLKVGHAGTIWLPFDPGTGVCSNTDIVRAFPEAGSRGVPLLAIGVGEARYTMFEVGTTRKIEYRIVVER